MMLHQHEKQPNAFKKSEAIILILKNYFLIKSWEFQQTALLPHT